MRRILLLTIAMLSIATLASANHIGIFSDASGASCYLAPGLNANVTVIEKFSLGSTGVRFSVTKGANEFVAFSSPYTTVGYLTSDITVYYDACLTGSNVVGTAVMNLTGGRLYIHPAQGQTQVLYTDCTFVDHRATWGYAVIGGSDYCAEALATESTTWGRVKELYR